VKRANATARAAAVSGDACVLGLSTSDHPILFPKKVIGCFRAEMRYLSPTMAALLPLLRLGLATTGLVFLGTASGCSDPTHGSDVVTTDATVDDALDAADATDVPDTSLPDVVIDSGPPTYAEVQGIFDHSCAVATTMCHSSMATASTLHLDAAHALAETLNVASTELPRMMRINPGNPTASYLYLKLQQTTLDPLPECQPDGGLYRCTAMPAPPMSPLSATQIELIRRWIELGAPTT
jgi:hypothetical protein